MQTNILLESGTNELEIVEFFIDEPIPGSDKIYTGYYGVNVAKVLEIIRLPEITEMPEATHPSVKGAFNLRSNIIPLVDLSEWLGKEQAGRDNAKVIVTEFNRVTNAFMVSGVNRIHRLSWEQVEPPNKYVTQFSDGSITGVVKIQDRIIFLLDLEKIIAELNPDLGLRLDDASIFENDTQYKAIVADDSALIRTMLCDLLEKARFNVEAHSDGRMLWERLEELKRKSEMENRKITDIVQVVISDIEMPSMDGHHLTKRVKTDPVLKDLPVILFSSLITDKLRHKGEAVGADEQISKPEVRELAVRAKNLIERKLGVTDDG